MISVLSRTSQFRSFAYPIPLLSEVPDEAVHERGASLEADASSSIELSVKSSNPFGQIA